MPIAGNCFCQLKCEITNTTGNVISGSMHLSVRNDTDINHMVSIPYQNAQSLSSGSVGTYTIQKQKAQLVETGKTITFVWPFTMTDGAVDKLQQIVIQIDKKSHIVRLNIMQ
jgi:hypothetical protein